MQSVLGREYFVVTVLGHLTTPGSEDSLQIQRADADILNMQSRTADKGW
jgi:hypothetical protein